MKYNFEKIISTGSGYRFTGMTKRDNKQWTITKDFYAMLNCERVELFLDKKNNAIMVKPTTSENFSHKIYSKGDTTKTMNCAEKELPLGRYYFKEKIGDGFVCVALIK